LPTFTFLVDPKRTWLLAPTSSTATDFASPYLDSLIILEEPVVDKRGHIITGALL